MVLICSLIWAIWLQTFYHHPRWHHHCHDSPKISLLFFEVAYETFAQPGRAIGYSIVHPWFPVTSLNLVLLFDWIQSLYPAAKQIHSLRHYFLRILHTVALSLTDSVWSSLLIALFFGCNRRCTRQFFEATDEGWLTGIGHIGGRRNAGGNS